MRSSELQGYLANHFTSASHLGEQATRGQQAPHLHTPEQCPIYWQRYQLSSFILEFPRTRRTRKSCFASRAAKQSAPLTHGDPSGIKVAEKSALCRQIPSYSARILHRKSSPRQCSLNAASGPNTGRGTACKTSPSSRNTVPRSTSRCKPSGCGAGSPIATASEHQMTTCSQRQVRNLILCCWLLAARSNIFDFKSATQIRRGSTIPVATKEQGCYPGHCKWRHFFQISTFRVKAGALKCCYILH